MNEIDKTKRLSDLTVAEFMQLMKTDTVSEKKYVYGIKGLARLLGCSRTKASEIKSSGILNDAIIQNGKLIVIDKEEALKLLKHNSIK